MAPEAKPNKSNIGRWGPCLHCGGTKPCKPCTLARQQRWADAKRERVRGHKAAYAAKYPDRVTASKAANYQRNGDEYYRRAQARRAADPQARRDTERKSYANNPKPFMVRKNRRDERDRAVGGKFTLIDKCALFQAQGGMCANPYCQSDLSISGFHADHIQPVLLGGSHDKANRQLLCKTCNHRKGALTNGEFLAHYRAEAKQF